MENLLARDASHHAESELLRALFDAGWASRARCTTGVVMQRTG
jgi:hypothetical protein